MWIPNLVGIKVNPQLFEEIKKIFSFVLDAALVVDFLADYVLLTKDKSLHERQSPVLRQYHK